MITFIIPTRNNLPYVSLAYSSIRKYYPTEEIIILDDGSTDGTSDFFPKENRGDPNLNYSLIKMPNCHQVGHTVLYDIGVAEIVKNEIFTIFHADMVCGPNYVENLIKHLNKYDVVCATRIEPPLHPPGNEKVTKDFGIYPNTFQHQEFEQFCLTLQTQTQLDWKNKVTSGIFAPWAMSKTKFLSIGGHDKLFSPFPYEDSDIFQRFILKDFKVAQSRDAFVYHFTCRGHRWTEQVGKDDEFYKLCCYKNSRHFIRKWGSWIENDEWCFPIINRKYDIGFVVNNIVANPYLLPQLEPWCNTIYTDIDPHLYIHKEQHITPFDLTKRVKRLSDPKTNNILIEFDAGKLTQESFGVLQKIAGIIENNGELGEFEVDIFKVKINSLESYETHLINTDDEYFKNQLIPISPSDPYYTDWLFSHKDTK